LPAISSAQAKDNLQIPEGHPRGHGDRDMILTALGQNSLFIFGRFAYEGLPTALQQLWRWAVFWHAM